MGAKESDTCSKPLERFGLESGIDFHEIYFNISILLHVVESKNIENAFNPVPWVALSCAAVLK